MDGFSPMGLSPPGSARMRSSTPRVIHVGTIISCKHQAIDDLPELEPPFKTLTLQQP